MLHPADLCSHGQTHQNYCSRPGEGQEPSWWVPGVSEDLGGEQGYRQ